MEREPDLYRCDNCPEEPGRICTRYKAGRARLIHRPTYALTGPKYHEPSSIDVSIYDCPFRQKMVKESNIKT